MNDPVFETPRTKRKKETANVMRTQLHILKDFLDPERIQSKS